MDSIQPGITEMVHTKYQPFNPEKIKFHKYAEFWRENGSMDGCNSFGPENYPTQLYEIPNKLKMHCFAFKILNFKLKLASFFFSEI